MVEKEYVRVFFYIHVSDQGVHVLMRRVDSSVLSDTVFFFVDSQD